MDEAAVMEAWQRCSTPNEKHKLIESMVGVFNAQAVFWMGGPGSEPMESTGKSVNEMVLGGRQLRMNYTGDVCGSSFEGIGYFGFDIPAGKFVGTWTDSMCTGIMYHDGEPTDQPNVIETRGQFTDPMGQSIKDRHVTTIIDDDHHTFEMYHTNPGEKEHKVGVITYTRAS